MGHSLMLQLLLRSQSSSLCVLELNLKLDSLHVAVLPSTLGIRKFIAKVVDDFLLL